MSATTKTDWFWNDWRGDAAVRLLTPTERGVWIDCLALMAEGEPHGYLTDRGGIALPIEFLAHFMNTTADVVDASIKAIVAKGVGSLDSDGRLYNRRMARRASNEAIASSKTGLLRFARAQAGRKGGIASALLRKQKQANGSENVSESDFASSKPQASASSNLLQANQAPRRATTSNNHLHTDESESLHRNNEPGGSLATAPPEGALRSPPDATPEGEPEGPATKRPDQMTAAEVLEARQKAKGNRK